MTDPMKRTFNDGQDTTLDPTSKPEE